MADKQTFAQKIQAMKNKHPEAYDGSVEAKEKERRDLQNKNVMKIAKKASTGIGPHVNRRERRGPPASGPYGTAIVSKEGFIDDNINVEYGKEKLKQVAGKVARRVKNPVKTAKAFVRKKEMETTEETIPVKLQELSDKFVQRALRVNDTRHPEDKNKKLDDIGNRKLDQQQDKSSGAARVATTPFKPKPPERLKKKVEVSERVLVDKERSNFLKRWRETYKRRFGKAAGKEIAIHAADNLKKVGPGGVVESEGAPTNSIGGGDVATFDPLLKNPKLMSRKQLGKKVRKLKKRLTDQTIFP